MNNRKQSHDYQNFLKANQATPPFALSKRIKDFVRTELDPSMPRVFSKLLVIHTFTALATIAVCHQFGIGIGDHIGLLHYFMRFGDYGCSIACGSFFMGMSLLVASSVLRAQEVHKIRQNRLLAFAYLSTLSLGFFLMLNAQLALGLTLVWLLGALFSSLATLELGWRLRLKSLSAA